MGTSQPSAMSLKSHFTVNISFPTKKRPNIATFCTSFFMLLLGKKNEFRTKKRLFLVFLYGIRVFRLQNYTLEVQSFCAVVIIYSPSLPILFFSVYIILIFRPINKYQNINNVYKGLILFFASKHLL